jgi:hypothetical protein
MTERPSVEAIAAALADPHNPVGKGFAGALTDDERFDCVARVLHGSQLSVEALNAIVHGDRDFEGGDRDSKALAAISGDIADCVSG